jgi:hypothetical protein
MANPVELYSGTESIGTTEHSLTTDTSGPDVDTADGWISAVIDFTNLAAGDQVQFTVYEKDRSGGTQRVMYQCFLTGAQGFPVFMSIPFPMLHGWDMTLKKIAGTDRTITWSLRQTT